jgi:hypothetical protein
LATVIDPVRSTNSRPMGMLSRTFWEDQVPDVVGCGCRPGVAIFFLARTMPKDCAKRTGRPCQKIGRAGRARFVTGRHLSAVDMRREGLKRADIQAILAPPGGMRRRPAMSLDFLQNLIRDYGYVALFSALFWRGNPSFCWRFAVQTAGSG